MVNNQPMFVLFFASNLSTHRLSSHKENFSTGSGVCDSPEWPFDVSLGCAPPNSCRRMMKQVMAVRIAAEDIATVFILSHNLRESHWGSFECQERSGHSVLYELCCVGVKLGRARETSNGKSILNFHVKFERRRNKITVTSRPCL